MLICVFSIQRSLPSGWTDSDSGLEIWRQIRRKTLLGLHHQSSLEVAKELKPEGNQRFLFMICGKGTRRMSLRAMAEGYLLAICNNSLT